MFFRLGQSVARYWWLVIVAWVALAAALRSFAPAWDSVTHDGDLAYLPGRSPSVVGEGQLEEAFPHDHAKSQLVVVISRADSPLAEEDIHVAYDVARRMKCLHGTAAFARLRDLEQEAATVTATGQRAPAEALAERLELAREEARQAFDEAAYFDQALVDFRRGTPREATTEFLAEIYWNRGLLLEHLRETDAALLDRNRAAAIDPAFESSGGARVPAGGSDLPIVDVWTWRDKIFGGKLISADRHARLVVLQIANEFLALRNQELLDAVGRHLDAARATLDERQRETLILQVSGSAAIGGDMLRAAKESIEDTELFTVLLIVVILTSVYRAPFLVVLPLVSIAVSLVVSTNLVAWLAAIADWPAVAPWWGFKIFTTTKIFIVVILFGAGTDFCLFLISRYREELTHTTDSQLALARTMTGVGEALTASAFTTIVGLAMMYFSEFGKFRYSGPVIGLCLSVTLLVCLTLTPALLGALGRFVFWPYTMTVAGRSPTRNSWSLAFWGWVADLVVHRPGVILGLSLVVMVPLAFKGMRSADHLTYDVLAGLSRSRPSRIGTAAMRDHFPVGESGPVTVVLLKRGADFGSEEGRRAIYELSKRLYGVEGVSVVRSLIDPLGEFPPGRTIGLTNERAWTMWLARPHAKTTAVFVANTPRYARDLTRLDIVLRHDPFSRDAMASLNRLDDCLKNVEQEEGSYWNECQIAYAGPTAAVRDLRAVTLGDRKRIEVLVVVAVYLVLVVILRRPLICAYLILSVLLTYFVTIGLTELCFTYAYGSSYEGLDWKVPMYLFVILVAVGQDYNVYLVTRVFEEQRTRGPLSGLRHAVVQTGGIITSCGIIMAGTFIAMTSVAWGQFVPPRFESLRGFLGTEGGLRGMVELGFALALGVTIDTLVVRPVLVPAFLALTCRFGPRHSPPTRVSDSDHNHGCPISTTHGETA